MMLLLAQNCPMYSCVIYAWPAVTAALHYPHITQVYWRWLSKLINHLPYPESCSWHCQWCQSSPLPEWLSCQSRSSQRSACLLWVSAPDAELTPSGCCSQQVCGRPPAACRQRSASAGQGGCLQHIITNSALSLESFSHTSQLWVVALTVFMYCNVSQTLQTVASFKCKKEKFISASRTVQEFSHDPTWAHVAEPR